MILLNFKKWYLKIFIIFIIQYLWNNGIYFFFTSYITEFSKNSFLFFFYIVSYTFPLVIIILFNWKQKLNIDFYFSNKKKEFYYDFFLLLLLVYLSSLVKSSFYYHKDTFQIFNFSYSVLIYFFSKIIFAPIIEEYFFRAVLFNDFINRKRYILGILISSFFFAISHFPLIYDFESFSLIKLIDLFTFGIVLGIIRIVLGIKYSILAHSFRNTLVLLFKYDIINLYFIDQIHNELLFNAIHVLIIISVIILITYFIFRIRVLANMK